MCPYRHAYDVPLVTLIIYIYIYIYGIVSLKSSVNCRYTNRQNRLYFIVLMLISRNSGQPFISLIKGNISSWFRSSKDVLSVFTIFDPKKVPYLYSHELSLYGDSSILILIGQIYQPNHWKEQKFKKEPLVSSDLSKE